MEILEKITKTREYLDYLEEHALNVQLAWEELKMKCQDMRFIWDDFIFFSIDAEIKNHDMSKMSQYEFIQYRRVFFPTELEAKSGKYSMYAAWEHHKKHNLHHWESWTKNISLWGNNPYKWEIHCVHMVVDWMAMAYKKGDTAEQYFEANKDKINIPEYAIRFIYEIFGRLKEED